MREGGPQALMRVSGRPAPSRCDGPTQSPTFCVCWRSPSSAPTARPDARPREPQVTDVVRLRHDALEWRLVEGEIVALDLERSEYLLVNRTGAVLWQLLVAGASPPEMVDRLVETYRLDETQARADIEAFLAGLAARQLLES